MTYRLILAYDGAPFAGWQRQPNAPTVQQTVEEALADLLLPEDPTTENPTQEETRRIVVVGSGRTDTGVHALGQVAHFEFPRPFPLQGLVHGTNQRLPESVRVMAAHRVADGFHAQRHAASKEYRYRLSRSPVLSPFDSPTTVACPKDLDRAAMFEATELLLGEHDFSAFAKTGGSHSHGVRTLFEAEWCESGDLLELRLRGSGFLRGMVRAVVGSLLEVGRGTRSIEAFRALFDPSPGSPVPERSVAGPNAPAHGLMLHEVRYDDWPALECYPEPEEPALTP